MFVNVSAFDDRHVSLPSQDVSIVSGCSATRAATEVTLGASEANAQISFTKMPLKLGQRDEASFGERRPYFQQPRQSGRQEATADLDAMANLSFCVTSLGIRDYQPRCVRQARQTAWSCGVTPTAKSGKKYEMKTGEFGRGAPVSGLFGGGSVYFAFEQLSACPPECEVGLVCADRFEMVTNHVVIICEAFDFQLLNCGRIG